VRSRRERFYRGEQAIARAQVTARISAFTPRMVIVDDSDDATHSASVLRQPRRRRDGRARCRRRYAPLRWNGESMRHRDDFQFLRRAPARRTSEAVMLARLCSTRAKAIVEMARAWGI